MISPQYFAGFFDGEGCASLIYCRRRAWKTDPSKSTFGFRLILTVSNTDRGILDEFQRAFGGDICLGNPRKRSPGHKPIFVWRLGGASAQIAMVSALLPHSIVKRRQLELAAAYLATAVEPGRRVAQAAWDERKRIFAEFRDLNRRGEPRAPKHSIPELAPLGLRPRQFYSKEELLALMERARGAKRRMRSTGTA